MNNADRVFIAVVVAVTVGVGGWLAMSLVPAANIKSLETSAQVLSAFGTLAAVVVALRVAHDGQRRLDRVDQQRAAHTAAKVVHLVRRLATRVSLARAGFVSAAQPIPAARSPCSVMTPNRCWPLSRTRICSR